MASSIMHMAVANEINKTIRRDKRKILIGSIAPDLSKLVGESKQKSHFLDNKESDIPNMEKFLNKYRNYLDDDFVLGYYIHLYTDYFWFKYFLSELIDENVITKLDGSTVPMTDDTFSEFIYNDYTNLNVELIEVYDLDLKIFFEEIPDINYIIEEIPMNKLNILLEKVGIIIENSNRDKTYVFNIDNVKKFINMSVELILNEIKILHI